MAVSADEEREVETWARDEEIPFPMIADPGLAVIRTWALKQEGADRSVPAAFVVDREGVVRFRQVGDSISDRATVEDLLAAIDGL